MRLGLLVVLLSVLLLFFRPTALVHVMAVHQLVRIALKTKPMTAKTQGACGTRARRRANSTATRAQIQRAHQEPTDRPPGKLASTAISAREAWEATRDLVTADKMGCKRKRR